MSRSIDLFIDAPVGLDDLASELTRLTGNPFVPVPDAPLWVMRDGDVVAELSEHRYANDGNLVLSRYRYCLSARIVADARLDTNSPEVGSLRSAQASIKQASSYPVLLVWDLQYRLEQHPGLGGADEPSLPREGSEPTVVEEPVS
jgi:hypothetical protein